MQLSIISAIVWLTAVQAAEPAHLKSRDMMKRDDYDDAGTIGKGYINWYDYDVPGTYKIRGADAEKMRDCLQRKNSRWPLVNSPNCPSFDIWGGGAAHCNSKDSNSDPDFHDCVKSTGIKLPTPV